MQLEFPSKLESRINWTVLDLVWVMYAWDVFTVKTIVNVVEDKTVDNSN